MVLRLLVKVPLTIPCCHTKFWITLLWLSGNIKKYVFKYLVTSCLGGCLQNDRVGAGFFMFYSNFCRIGGELSNRPLVTGLVILSLIIYRLRVYYSIRIIK